MSTNIKLYSASELRDQYPDGFENALEHWRDSQDEIFWMNETIDSLKALIKASGLYLRDWSLGTESYRSYINIDWELDVAILSGQRAMAWLENNLLSDLRIKKNTKDYLKYNNGYIEKSLRPYSVGKIPPCPFTGYCADDTYLDSLIKDITNGCTLEEAYNNLAGVCSRMLENDLDNQNSEEYFLDHADVNQYQFTEDGQIVW